MLQLHLTTLGTCQHVIHFGTFFFSSVCSILKCKKKKDHIQCKRKGRLKVYSSLHNRDKIQEASLKRIKQLSPSMCGFDFLRIACHIFIKMKKQTGIVNHRQVNRHPVLAISLVSLVRFWSIYFQNLFSFTFTFFFLYYIAQARLRLQGSVDPLASTSRYLGLQVHGTNSPYTHIYFLILSPIFVTLG